MINYIYITYSFIIGLNIYKIIKYIIETKQIEKRIKENENYFKEMNKPKTWVEISSNNEKYMYNYETKEMIRVL